MMPHERLDADMQRGMSHFVNRKTPEDGVDVWTPRDALMAKESLPEMMAAEFDGTDDECGEYELRQRQAGGMALMRFLLGSGAHPLRVLRRVIALATAMRMEPFVSMTYDELGLLTGEGKAAFSYQMKKLAEVITANGGERCMKLPGQKPPDSTEHYAAAQAGNGNRANGEKRKAVHKVRCRFKEAAARSAGQCSQQPTKTTNNV